MTQPIKKLLVANRGEIAIRIFRACSEMGITTVGIYSRQDRLALFRSKADEAYLVGQGKGAVEAYLDQQGIIDIALKNGADAIHPGYGFLSENPEFAKRVMDAGLIWVGPSPESMLRLGDKVSARQVAHDCGVSVVPGSPNALRTFEEVQDVVNEINFPIILKAARGGGGRGMSVVRQQSELKLEWERCCREAEKAFGNGDVFVERFVENPHHIEVQILGDDQGNVVHLFERDCSVQRRFQKIVEAAPCRHISDETREILFSSSLKLAKHVGYHNAGTMEFLVESQGEHKGKVYFIEANTRLQVEHTVTEWVTGVDLVQSQLKLAMGQTLSDMNLSQETVQCHGHAIQCRINAEDASADFAPQTGIITTWRSAAGMGVRLDSGGGDTNIEVGSDYDSLLCKVSTWAPSFEGCVLKMDRALREFRIRGVRTNIPFLLNVVRHPTFQTGTVTTAFVDTCSELFDFPPRLNRANKILYYLGHCTLHRERLPTVRSTVPVPEHHPSSEKGSRELFHEMGREAFFQKIRNDDKLWLTDTTLRDAHQSLLATRMRTKDMLPAVAAMGELPYFSLEVWGGATYDVAYRFLKECPWQRLEQLRERAPKVLFQMLLRGSNVLGYKNQPDNLIQEFVKEAHRTGIDVFRIFDALNYTPNLKVSMETVREVGGIAEASVCYTGDVAQEGRTRYSLQYYVDLASELYSMGADIIAIKDMAGLLTPKAARLLIPAIREAVPCPVHYHNHDTSALGGATILRAARCGVDVVDAALGPLSGVTSQPNLGSLVSVLHGDERDTGVNPDDLMPLEYYWQGVREYYDAFESGLKTGSSSVYWHEIPGGQYSNLLPQAKALGIDDRWGDVLQSFHDANLLMGDPVKVTPTSKAVGDVAMAMVNAGLSFDDVKQDPRQLDWPGSAVDYFKGMMGQHPYGFPEDIQKAVLGNEEPLTGRAGDTLEPIQFDVVKKDLGELLGHEAKVREVLSHVLFEGPFRNFSKHQHKFGDTSILDTELFFTGLEIGQEVTVELEQGKILIIKLLSIGQPDERGERPFNYELNGQPRTIRIRDFNLAQDVAGKRQADEDRDDHVGAPMPGKVSRLLVIEGQEVDVDTPLFVIEAMKMETIIVSKFKGSIKEICMAEGEDVAKADLVMLMELSQKTTG